MTRVTLPAAEALASAPLLRGASEAALADLWEAARVTTVPAREWLFRAGDPGDRLYVVISGRLQVVADGPPGERVLREVGPGAALGELALLTGAARSAGVRALRDSRLAELDADRFTALLEREPGLAVAVARELARQLQASGGLALPEARPAVIALVAAGGADVAAFAARLREAFAGPVALLDGRGLEHDVYGAAVDDAESAHEHVLLLDDGRSGDAWGGFCRRQCDRLLVVAASGDVPAAVPEPLHGADLVLHAVDGPVAPWLDVFEPRAHYVVPAGSREGAAVARLARRLAQRSLGLVFSGGGARGFAHIGALGVLQERGLEPDRFGGCSMGSLIAGMAALGWRADEIAERCRAELVRRSPFNDYTLPRVALIRSRKAAAMLTRVFGDGAVEELERPLYTVSADLLTSRVVVHRTGPLIEAVGCSMSIPGLAPPVARSGRLLVDGGVLNNLPVDHMAETAEGPVVAVDVVRRMEADPEGGDPPLPTITETLARATVLASVERAERNRTLAALVVNPDVQDVALRDFSQLDRAIEAGRRAAEAALEEGGEERLRAQLAD